MNKIHAKLASEKTNKRQPHAEIATRQQQYKVKKPSIKIGGNYPHSGGIAKVNDIYVQEGETMIDYTHKNLIHKEETQTLHGFILAMSN